LSGRDRVDTSGQGRAHGGARPRGACLGTVAVRPGEEEAVGPLGPPASERGGGRSGQRAAGPLVGRNGLAD
jgi:hypothetical protein